MIPCDKPITCLRHKTGRLPGRAAGAVIHRVSALPFPFDGTFKNGNVVGCAKKGRKQPVFVPSARNAVGNLRRVVGRPPDFIRTRRRWRICAGAAGNR